MLGRVVSGSRTWMCTIAAPALAASTADCAICAGVTGTAGFLPGVSADPVTAQEIMTLRCILAPAACFRAVSLACLDGHGIPAPPGTDIGQPRGKPCGRAERNHATERCADLTQIKAAWGDRA